MEGIIIPMSFFAFILGLVYLQSRKKERMAMIERGMDVSSLENKKPTKVSYASLKYGMLLVGVGFGLLIANVMVNNRIMEEEVAYFSLTFLFGGIALVANYFISRRMVEQEKFEN